jgi:hypothetical protein
MLARGRRVGMLPIGPEGSWVQRTPVARLEAVWGGHEAKPERCPCVLGLNGGYGQGIDSSCRC